ncbi:MAG TPA: helix-turn-helix transcriptional regulator [Gammaproteobacteria bacterium]|jgi:transcriptional regulator with XRE-family HTH domain|nr:helix-turn-helix transcriptional regulator [Gammaproteobacteria bacterium]
MNTETRETELISFIIESARQLNISQGELARRAGIRQETLSRAKRNPAISLKTFQALARAAGLRIQLVPDNYVAEQVAKGSLFPT